MNPVDGKVALITGAARGIGKRTAEVLAEAGATVVLTDMNEEEGQTAAAAIPNAQFMPHDVTREDDWVRVTDDTVAAHGQLDVVVNNAGIFYYRSIEELTLDDWQRITHVNLDGVFLGTKHAMRVMKAAGADGPSRSIVNLSSVAGIVGALMASAYNMTKGGVRLFTKGAALECATLGYNIRVNSVHPGVIDTQMGDQVIGEMVALGVLGTEAEIRERVSAMHPIGRIGTVDDVANAICFLASDDSAFMTGAELVVDGGLTAQ